MTQTNESMIPIIGMDMVQVSSLEGYPVYTSKDLKKEFIQSLDKSGLVRKIPNISYLVDRDIIIPGMLSRSIFHFLSRKAFANKISKMILAYFDSRANKVYILLDNNTKNLIWTKDTEISKFLIHELIHLFCRSDHNNFTKIFMKYLISFYQNFFKLYGDIKLNDSQAKQIVHFMLMNFEWKQIKRNSILQYYNFLTKLLSKTVEKEELEEFLKRLLSKIFLFLKDPNLLISVIGRSYDGLHMIKSIYGSYHIFNFYPESFPIQELIFPSEVISMLSETMKPDFIRAVQLIKV